MKCVICKKREANITFCNSVLDYSHGFTADICRECYIEKIEKEIKSLKKNWEEQKKLLKKEKNEKTN